MTCIHEFFSPDYQKALKQQTFELNTYEQRLTKYKELLIDGIQSLSVECSCSYCDIIGYSVNSNCAIEYMSQYIDCLKSLSSEIEKFCNTLIDSYKLFIKESYYSATSKFWEIIDNYNLVTVADNSIFNERIFYRARYNDHSFDINNPINNFHIRFDNRYLVSNQRFSVAGQPMWYLGNSIIDICRELNKDLDELVIYGFLPTFKIIKSLILLDSIIFNKFVKNLPFSINITIEQVKSDIQKTILYEFLIFPRRHERFRAFSEEYILSQAYTTYVLNQDKWNGIIYPSSKDYSDIKNVHPYSRYNYNCALFTNYSEGEIYDKNLFYQTYHDYSALYFDKNENDVTLSEAKNKIETLCKINQELKSPCLAYSLHSEQDLFEYLKDATLNGESFFDTQYGKAELKMFAKLCNILREAMYYQYEQKSTILPVSKHLNLIE